VVYYSFVKELVIVRFALGQEQVKLAESRVPNGMD
jgi:hypothetical protein